MVRDSKSHFAVDDLSPPEVRLGWRSYVDIINSQGVRRKLIEYTIAISVSAEVCVELDRRGLSSQDVEPQHPVVCLLELRGNVRVRFPLVAVSLSKEARELTAYIVMVKVGVYAGRAGGLCPI